MLKCLIKNCREAATPRTALCRQCRTWGAYWRRRGAGAFASYGARVARTAARVSSGPRTVKTMAERRVS